MISPEYVCLKLIQLMHVPHFHIDNITIIYIFKNFYYVMSPTVITYRLQETFFLFSGIQFDHFFKITKLNSKSLPGRRWLRYGHFRQCEMKKNSALDMGTEWRGMFFITTGGVLAGSAGYFLKQGGVQAGYWRGISIVGDLSLQYRYF